RDVAIARVLRRLVGNISIEWCSAEPVVSYLRLWGEKILRCEDMESFSKAVEEVIENRIMNPRRLGKYLDILRKNYRMLVARINLDDYDLVFADEFWEIMLEAPPSLKEEIVFATDILFKPYTLNPLDSLVSLVLNTYFKKQYISFKETILLNSLEDLPSSRWFLIYGENIRRWAARNLAIAGLATSYLPEDVPLRHSTRKSLGLDDEDKLVLVTVGGTATRNNILLGNIVGAILRLRRRLARLKLLVALGPRTKWKPPIDAEWITVTGTVKNLVKYYVAADLVIARPGRTTTADLLCMGKPAILVPISGHFEHNVIARSMASRGYLICKEDDQECIVRAASRLLSDGHNIRRPAKEECRGSLRAAKILASFIKGGS
ncbi:MAG: glycosyltransferase, partial [Pyrodictiaceae archaeon]